MARFSKGDLVLVDGMSECIVAEVVPNGFYVVTTSTKGNGRRRYIPKTYPYIEEQSPKHSGYAAE